MKLISNWKQSWRFWSMRLGVIGSAVTSVLVAFPDAAIGAWAILPEMMKDTIPAEYMPLLGVSIFATALLARMIKQEDLE